MVDRVPKLRLNQQLVSVIITPLSTEEEEEEEEGLCSEEAASLFLHCETNDVDAGVSLSSCSFLQGRSFRGRSPCVKTRRTPARCWSPLTSGTGS